MKSFFKALFILLLLAGIGGGVAGWMYLSAEVSAPGPLAAKKVIHIAPGSVGTITDTLVKEGVIAEPYIFRFADWKMKGKALQAGEYEFKANISPEEIITLLQSGQVYQRQLTIPEGLTSYEIVELLNKAPAMEGNIETVPAEGTLQPETYNYTYGNKRAAMLDRMATGMKKTLAEYFPKKSANSLVKTEEEAVILASIVERETGVTTERAKVAGVFMNRIRQGWPLQSDPTVIYALTEGKGKLNRSLTRNDLNMESPYNTYQVKGLPPGPIANPGRESIIAVLQPEAHEFMFFVADGTGGHAFARTNDEHVVNVNKWRALQR